MIMSGPSTGSQRPNKITGLLEFKVQPNFILHSDLIHDKFIDEIDNGHIAINFRITTEDGKYRDRGTEFRIDGKNMHLMYTIRQELYLNHL